MEGTCPPGTPFRHPHSEQRRPARAHAVGPLLGPHARIDRTRDTRIAEPWLHAPEDGRPGEGQRLTTGAPHNGGRHPPPGTPFRHPHSEQRRPARAHAVGPVLGPHARIDRTRDTRVAEPWLHAPEDGRPGEGQRLTPGAPHNGGRNPPPGTPFRHPHGEQRRPARAHAGGPVLGSHARIDRTRDTRVAEPWLPAPEDGRPGEGQRLTPGAPHNGGRHPPRGRPSTTPTAGNAGPQGRTLWGRCWVHTPASTAPDRTRDTRVAEPWLPAPEDGRLGEGQRLTPGAPHTGGRHPPGDALLPPPQRAMPARRGARCGAGAGSTRPHRPHPGHTGRGTLAARSRGRAVGGGTAPDTRRPSQPAGAQGRCWVHTPASTAPGTHGSRNPGCPLQRTGGRGRDSA